MSLNLGLRISPVLTNCLCEIEVGSIEAISPCSWFCYPNFISDPTPMERGRLSVFDLDLPYLVTSALRKQCGVSVESGAVCVILCAVQSPSLLFYLLVAVRTHVWTLPNGRLLGQCCWNPHVHSCVCTPVRISLRLS